MITIIQEKNLELRPGGTVKFEGAPYGSPVSFFHTKNRPGTGASLHIHPYPETWLVRSGNVRFTVGGENIEAQSGEIVVAPADLPHKFVNIGSDQLEMVCIHPSPRVIQENLEE